MEKMNTLSINEKKLITHLRNDSREKLTVLSRKINMPVSTIHEKIKKYKGNIINKSTILLNATYLGFPLRTHTILSVDKTSVIVCATVKPVIVTNIRHGVAAITIKQSRNKRWSIPA